MSSRLATLPETLARTARERPETGVTVVDSRGRHAERRSWAELRDAALLASAQLAAAGVEPGDRVLVSLPTSWDWFDAWFGALLLGAVPAAAASPGPMGSSVDFARRISRLAERIAPRRIVAGGALKDDLRALGPEHFPEAAGQAASLLTPAELARLPAAVGREPAAAVPEDTAFLQFTSGSTGLPRAARITHAAVLHNNAASDEAIGTPMGAPVGEWARAMVSWLPLHHDMGLVGGVFMAMTLGLELTLLNPVTFLARPQRWLERLAQAGDTFAPAPNFGYQLCVERLRAEQLDGCDLSGWRSALTGAEMVRPETAAAFCDLTARNGFRPGAFCPCYGMAETTLAITFDLRGQGIRTLPLPAGADAGLGMSEVVSVGSPVRDTQARICAPDGASLPDGAIGEIQVAGPAVFPGYWNDAAGTEEALRDGWLHTGDLGFMLAGEVYLTGRLKDVLIIKGQNVMPHEIEWAAESVGGGGGTRRCGAFSVARGADGEQAILVMETEERTPRRLARLDRDIRSRIGRALTLPLADLVWVQRGKIPRTSSGKVRRADLRRLYVDGRLERLTA